VRRGHEIIPKGIFHDFDDLGRLTQRVEADLTSSWLFDSCHFGRLCQDGTSNTAFPVTRTYTYDSLGRPLTSTATSARTFTSTRSYDSYG
jgi:YD repeat-containing protein